MNMSNDTVRLTLETKRVLEMIDEVNSILERDVKGNLFVEFRERLLRFLESPSEMVCFDNEAGPASGAGECGAILKPSDSFLGLVFALRAWNLERSVTV